MLPNKNNQTKGNQIMKKTFKLVELDCANCAAKMERAIAKIEGVIYVNISFMTQKITIEANDEVFNEVLEKADAACKKVDRNCHIEK